MGKVVTESKVTYQNPVPLHKGHAICGCHSAPREIWRLRSSAALPDCASRMRAASLILWVCILQQPHTQVSSVRRDAACLLFLVWRGCCGWNTASSRVSTGGGCSSAERTVQPVQVPFLVYKALGSDLVIAFDIFTTLLLLHCKVGDTQFALSKKKHVDK